MLKKTSLAFLVATACFTVTSSAAFAQDTNDTTTSTVITTAKSIRDKEALQKWRNQVEVWETTILRIHEAKKEYIVQMREEFEVAIQTQGLTSQEKKALKVAYALDVAALRKSARWFIASLGPRPVKPVAAK